jgi:hypothetical protein
MKKIVGKSLLLAMIAFFFLVKSVDAASLGFNSQSASVSVGEKVRVDLLLNVAAPESVWGYDAYIKFSDSFLTYNPADFLIGNLFATGARTVNSHTGDLISLGSYFNLNEQGVTSGGVAASLFFTGRAAGSAKIEIVCGSFTNIWQTGGGQINLFTNCASLLPSSTIVVAALGSPSSTPAPTATTAPGATSAPAPTATTAPTSAPGQATSTPVLTSTPTVRSSSNSSGTTPTNGAGLAVLPETGSVDGMLRIIYIGLGMIAVGIFVGIRFSRIKKS